MKAPQLRRRQRGQPEALPANLHPVLRRVYASRGVGVAELALDLQQLIPPTTLKGVDDAALLLEQALRQQQRIVVAGDYDADGATATALALWGLRAMGATQVDYVVPDRFRMGYGLSPALAELAAQKGAQLLVTVDNGIASVAGVARARELGMTVLITDHHLPGPELPSAAAIVNPNQPGCTFPSKHLAGVGVMFYVLMALRTRLREQGWFAEQSVVINPASMPHGGTGTSCPAQPNLAEGLDLVALGTVADLVKLDANNRVLVEQGLRRIRAGRARSGITALLEVGGRQAARISAADLGFVLGPRINAAGRLDDIRTGIECLLAPDTVTALPLARTLDQLNRERRELQSQMVGDAEVLVEESEAVGVCLFDESWHEGVVGLVASRIKERLHRPAIAFARAQEAGVLKGSGRSIAGLHLRDALALVDAQHPGLILRFGGHAMAAGLTLAEPGLDAFSAAFDAVCRQQLSPAQLEQVLETDGPLDAQECTLETAAVLEHAGPWGQGFAEPLFEGDFRVVQARLIGSQQTHVKYRLESAGQVYEAVDFGGAERLVERGEAQLVYRLAINRFRGQETLDLQIVEIRPA